MPMENQSPVLVTGATGYVGSRLVARLLEGGVRVRAAGRSLDKLRGRLWAKHPLIELQVMDALDAESVSRALKDCGAAYYLVHSMHPGNKNFSETDRRAAEIFVQASEKAEALKRIVYLGGLGEDHPDLSLHLKSRTEVARILQGGKVPVTVFRAAMIIGSGSASFEILRYLVDRLPVMVTPRWVETLSQPIAIQNVLTYLAECLKHPETAGQTFDIGGSGVLTYRELMRTYAEEAGLPKRIVFPVPVLTPRLSSYWIHLVTPVPASIAKPLAEGLKNAVVCRDRRIEGIIPQKLLSSREAIAKALEEMKSPVSESSWTDAGKIPPAFWSQEGDPSWAGGTVFRDQRKIFVNARPSEVWPFIRRIGGRSGWYHADWLWKIRGDLDRLLGGAGLRRGRRDADHLAAGDALDFWRVAAIDPEVRLLLAAEMKLPGYAVLEFKLAAEGQGAVLTQTASFKPRGLWGILYWFGVFPLHAYIFDGMLRKIARAAEKEKGNLKPGKGFS